MNDREFDDPTIWQEMRERLSALSLKQLKQLAKDEEITLGFAASRKDACVGAIVAERRHRAIAWNSDPKVHPWRKWNSVKHMHVWHVNA